MNILFPFSRLFQSAAVTALPEDHPKTVPQAQI
jgi:hypothetical protein